MKAIVISLLLFGALQQGIALHNEDYAVKNNRNLIDDIVNTLLQLITSTLDNIMQEIDKAIEKISDILNNGIQLVNKGIEAMLEVINDFEKKALDLGVDIAVCVVDQKKLINQMKDDTISNLQNTADNIIDGIGKIKNETTLQINEYIEVVQTLLQDLKKCGIRPLCIAKVTAKATATSIKLTAELPLLAVRIIKIIGETVVVGTSDMAKITAEFTSWSIKIMAEITACVAEKIPIL